MTRRPLPRRPPTSFAPVTRTRSGSINKWGAGGKGKGEGEDGREDNGHGYCDAPEGGSNDEDYRDLDSSTSDLVVSDLQTSSSTSLTVSPENFYGPKPNTRSRMSANNTAPGDQPRITLKFRGKERARERSSRAPSPEPERMAPKFPEPIKCPHCWSKFIRPFYFLDADKFAEYVLYPAPGES